MIIIRRLIILLLLLPLVLPLLVQPLRQPLTIMILMTIKKSERTTLIRKSRHFRSTTSSTTTERHPFYLRILDQSSAVLGCKHSPFSLSLPFSRILLSYFDFFMVLFVYSFFFRSVLSFLLFRFFLFILCYYFFFYLMLLFFFYLHTLCLFSFLAHFTLSYLLWLSFTSLSISFFVFSFSHS